MSIEPPSSAAEALDIVERQRRAVAAALMPELAVMHGAWGLAWLVGGVLYYGYAVGLVGGLVTALAASAALLAAAAASTVAATRGTRGVRSGADRQTAMYGASWPVGMVLTGVLAAGLGGGGTVTAVLFVFVAGVLCMGAGVVWTNWPQYIGGVLIATVAAVAAFVPAPASILVLALGGGGTWLGLGVWFRVAGPRP